jgi:septum formation protein
VTTLVLASASPRRWELLDRFGLPVEVRPADVDERRDPDEDPEDMVRRLAVDKAQAVLAAGVEPDLVVLAADTVVVLGDEVLGKPADGVEAAEMLRRLSGRTHQVLTGVAVVASRRPAPSEPSAPPSSPAVTAATARPLASPDEAARPGAAADLGVAVSCDDAVTPGAKVGPAATLAVTVEATEVAFVALTEADIAWYVATGEPLDKAGAYAVQGCGGVFVASIRGSWDNVVGLPLVATRGLLAEAGLDLLAR